MDLRRLCPHAHVFRSLKDCADARFTRDADGHRLWEYDPPERVADAVLGAIANDGSTLEELQRDLGRRFQVVRRALLRLERNGKVERIPSDREDLETWYIVK